jgi:hypothetical protein
MLDHLMTLPEAAASIHPSVKPRALREAIGQGRLIATRIGRAILVTEANLEAFLRSSQCPAQTEALALSSTDPMASTAQRPGGGSTALVHKSDGGVGR